MGGIARIRVQRSMMLILAFSLMLAGCGSSLNQQARTTQDGSSEASADVHPITITAFINTPNHQPTPDNRIYKKIQESLGVKLQMEFSVGDLQQKLLVMIEGGNYPDLITADPKLVSAKAVIPLENLIEKYAPHLKQHYAKVWSQMKDPSDGHIYWLPNYGIPTGKFLSNYYSGPAFWIQKDVLKEEGYPTPKTLDDYMKLIRDYAAKHPTIDGEPTVGFSSLVSDWRTFPLFNAPEHLTGHPNDGTVVVDNGVASVFADMDIAKRYYKVLNGLYNDGFMDKEAFVQNYDQYLEKIASGRVLGMFDQHWNFQPAEDKLISQNKIGKTYVGFPIVYDSGIKDNYLTLPPPNLNNGFGISKDAKDPVRIIKFLDALMTEDWQKLLQWGERGIDYEVDANGRFYRTPEQRKEQGDTNWRLANKADGYFGAAPKLEGTYGDGNATDPIDQPDEFYASLNPEDKQLLDAYGHKTWTDFFRAPAENPVYFPAYTIDLKEDSEASLASRQMSDASIKYLPVAIMSKSNQFDSIWNEYVKTYAKINVKAYEDRINNQIQWRIKNWSNGS